ncbi:MAG: hemolysin family protein [Planctomycetota bacterium]
MNLTPLLAVGAPTSSDVPAIGWNSFNGTLLIVFFAIAIGVSFLCSMLEAGVLSLPRSYIASLKAAGSKTGVRFEKIKDNLDRALAAILTLNTIAHTFGAAGVGAQVQIMFGSTINAIGMAVLTLLILVLSEIIPKSLGAAYARPLAPFTAITISILIILLWPILVPLNWMSKWFGGGHTAPVSREEIASMADIGLTDGALDREELRVIRNLLGMTQVPVKEVMTPRPVVFALPQDTTVQQVVDEHGRLRFSRIPVYEGDLDHVTGKVTRHAILHAYADGDTEKPLKDLMRDMPVVPDAARLDQIMDRFIREQRHAMLVVDEFGGTAGMITLEDCIETLLGVEIVDETDTTADMRELARRLMERKRHGADVEIGRA